MMGRNEADDPDFVANAFGHALRGEPALTLDLVAIEHRGRRRLVRRRLAVMAGAGLAVITLTAGIAFGASGLAGSTGPASLPKVPGCDTVVRTTDPAMLSWMHDGQVPSQTPTESRTGAETTAAEAGIGDVSVSEAYQTPAWFTPEKAASMRTALDTALPAGIELQAAGDGTALPFIDRPDGVGLLGATEALLSIQAQQWDREAPPCTETVSLRYTAPDGTVADVITGGGPGAGRYIGADAYHPDGTWVSAMLSSYPSSGPTSGPAQLPMTERELAMLVADPALAIS